MNLSKSAGPIAACLLCLLASCNNFFHELIPPDGDRITSFQVPGQRGEAVIGDTVVSAVVDRDTAVSSLIPRIQVSEEATILPLTLDYIARAFPSVDIVREALAIYSTDDLSSYVIDLIRRTPGFNVPALDQPIDFSGPVSFLVVGGLGSIRRYTVYVTADTGTAKLLGFGFSKYDNDELTRDALSLVNEAAKTVLVYAVYPAEYTPGFSLVPGFELLGDTLTVIDPATSAETVLRPGIDPIQFDPVLSLQTRNLRVDRAGYPSALYTLMVYFSEDPDSIRSITDFRFRKTDNPGLAFDAVASIVNNDNLGTIRVQVMYQGAKPPTLIPRFVTPGTVSVGGSIQTTGASAQDFSGPLEYQVVSKSGQYTRLYTVKVEFVNLMDTLPRILSFRFGFALNPDLVQDTAGSIDDGSGLILIDAHYGGPAAPQTLIPEFSAGGIVKVSGMNQSSGASAQDFTRQIKYSVYSPDNPTLAKDYWVQVRFIRDTSSDAAITAFSFHPGENPGLPEEIKGRIDQGTGQIYLYAPYGSGAANGPMIPRFEAQGRVTVAGQTQTSGADSRYFNVPVVYDVESANGINHKSYTVTVQELDTVLYVRQGATGRNNGTSWEDAFISLKAACEAAADLFPPDVPKEIWIAKGTYRPSETGDSAAYFPISSNTGYIGGFAGWETAKSQRNPAANTVTISGDLGGGSRSRRLFRYSQSDGGPAVSGDIVFEDLSFTRARGADSGDTGPGITLDTTLGGGVQGRVELKNCVFTDLESPGQGGALCLVYPDITLDSVTITGTKGGSGGGAYLTAAGSLELDDVTINDADATYYYGSGGGLYICNLSSSGLTTVSGLNITNAKVSGNGGGAYIVVNGPLSLDDVTITNTETTGALSGGGGLYIISMSSGLTAVSGLSITNAKADYGGGGAYLSVNGPLRLDGVTINDAEVTGIFSTGGGLYIYNTSSGPTSISGLEITNAKASNDGGGACLITSGLLTLDNVTINGTETTSGSGGGLYIWNNSSDSITVSGLNITNTKAGYNGGGAYLSVAGPLTLDNVTINGAEATSGNGGGLYISNSSESTISGLTITNAKAGYNGGGAYLSVAGPLTLDNVMIKDAESSSGYGSGAVIISSNFSVTNTTVNGVNRAGSYPASSTTNW